MKSSSASKIKINSYNDLFGADSIEKSIQMIALDKLHPFKNHPFKVLDNEEMEELVESIREKGIVTPAIVRKRTNGEYELISGHRRKRAAELAGLNEMPVLVRELTDDEAVIIMADSNLQREHILPSEKAFAYRMKLEAMRHPGVKGKASSKEAGKDFNDSGRQVQRYIRLTYLIPDLLEYVDQNHLTVQAGVAFSYLNEEKQSMLNTVMMQLGKFPNGTTSETIRDMDKQDELTEDKIRRMLSSDKISKAPKRNITLKQKYINQYFPLDYDNEQIEEVIIQLLEQWKQQQT